MFCGVCIRLTCKNLFRQVALIIIDTKKLTDMIALV